MTRILITGVRAKTGRPLAAMLRQRREVDVLGGTGDPDGIRLDGIRLVPFSWDNRTTWAAAEQIDAMFLVRPDRADAPELVSDLLAVTPRAAHIVLLSELDNGYFAAGDWTLRTERAVRDSGRTWTILRPNWFMQVFTDERFLLGELQRGRLPFPSGGQRVAWLDTRDIAAAAERALLETTYRRAILDLTGPEALTLGDTARILSRGLGRTISHAEISMNEALTGTKGFARQNDEGAYERVRLGHASVVNNTVERVTGQPARTLASFAAEQLWS